MAGETGPVFARRTREIRRELSVQDRGGETPQAPPPLFTRRRSAPSADQRARHSHGGTMDPDHSPRCACSASSCSSA
jgi:hypothetical protein